MAETELNILIKANDQASKAISGVGGALSGLGNIAAGALKVGALAGVAGIGALAAGIGASVKEAMAAEEVQAQLGAVLKSTGGKAGVSAEMANELATALQGVTRFSDETVLSGENMLLTFTNVGKDVFPMATETMLDMSQALGQDVKNSAIQLGKALNDPIQGVTALRRVGVQFTDAQQEEITALVESGNLLGAQKMILKELQTEFGGAAKAAGETFAGKMDILQNKVSDIMETIGGAFLPLLTEAAGGLADLLARPEIQAGIQNLAEGFANIARDVAGFVGGLGNLNLGEALAGLFGGGAGMAEGINSALGGIVENVKTKIGEIIAAIQSGNIGEALATALLPVGVDTGGLAAVFNNVISTVQSAFGGLMSWITGTLAPALSESFAQIAEAAGPALGEFGNFLNTIVLPALQQFADFIGPVIGAGLAALGDFIVSQLIPAFTQFVVWVFSQGLPAFGALANQIGGAINQAIAGLIGLWRDLNVAVQNTVAFIQGVAKSLEEVATVIRGAVGPAILWLIDNIIKPLAQAIAGILVKIHELLEALRNVGSAVAGLPGGIGGAVNNAFGGGQASGGPVSADRTYLIGERGPELFSPMRSGYIIPNHELRAAASDNAGVTFNGSVTFVVPNMATWDNLMQDARLRALAARTT